ncbi:hypothetical protein NE619_12520 [Anaerovorax odorimutans]|uniref:Uncharacterized protein n=1 Tax=Anaerovorax odorimutans TaxID=109327 RepID=A0ABT1RQV4_9FIRM|nr:hypothetical protein [Anaerovorax odorimutans]MCQ4637553.1 hypothetical protein [Anaerovorax odorimutans]
MNLYEIFVSVAVGMITGMLSGWLSGFMVMNHYRKIDDETQRRQLHIKYLEATTMHVSKVLNEIDLLIHRDGPLDYENALREIGVFQIPSGKLDEKDDSAAIIQEKTALMDKIEKGIKNETLDLRQAAMELIKLSAKLIVAMENYRREKL